MTRNYLETNVNNYWFTPLIRLLRSQVERVDIKEKIFKFLFFQHKVVK